MTELDKKLIDAFLITVAIVGIVVAVFRMSDCNEYQSRLTGKPAFGQSLPPSLCADPPCVEGIGTDAQP